MPLIYLPLILYTSWMELMLQPLRASDVEAASEADVTARHPAR